MKLGELINSYQQRLHLREQKVRPYRERYNKDSQSLSEKEYMDFKVLETEINIYKKFIDYHKYIINKQMTPL